MLKYTGCYSRMEIEAFTPPEDSVLVCIRDPGSSYPTVGYKDGKMVWRHVTHLDFWDTEPTKPDRVRFPELAKMMLPATEDEIARIKESIDWFPECHIFASCEAGISRSAAVREFLVRRGWVYLDGAQERRMVHPNSYILSELEKMYHATLH